MSASLACTVAIALLLALDFVWLALLGAGQRFLTAVKSLGAAPTWSAWQLGLLVAGAYVLLGWGLCSFAVLPALEQPSPRWSAVAKGALFGFVVYGVFDLTNLALFGSGYGFGLAASDMAWGTFVCGAAALGGTLAA